MHRNITDIGGVKVGHASDLTGLTGCTVVLTEGGAVAGVDVRGSAPGTREVELLKPVHHIDRVHGIFLTGGSAFGLNVGGGIMKYLEEKDIGYDTVVAKVPIVPGAVLFDLSVGDFKARPGEEMGYEACLNATAGAIDEGSVGAGTGASVGKILGMDYAMKGGTGSWSLTFDDGIVVGAIVAVNALGDVRMPYSDDIIAGAYDRSKGCFINTTGMIKEGRLQLSQHRAGLTSNTTLAVVATNAALTKEGATKVAQMAQDGLARTISPVHTAHDGDTIFALSTGDRFCDISIVGTVAAEVLAEAVVRAVKLSQEMGGLPSYSSISKGNL